MEVNFTILGRLGNAIYRYMAAAIVCTIYTGNYVVNNTQNNNLNDNDFYNIFIKNIKKSINSVNLVGYYQHDNIYKYYKECIKKFIISNPEHFVITDGITAGDNKCEKFYMINIIQEIVFYN